MTVLKVGRFTLLSKGMQENNELNQPNKQVSYLKQIASNRAVIYSVVTTLALSTIISVVTICGFSGRIEVNIGLDGIGVTVDTRPAPPE